MTRAEAIKAYREARDEADMILVGFILANPGTNLEGLCKEADPDEWKALASRVRRRLKKARSEGDSERTDQPARTPAQRRSDAKRFFDHAEAEDIEAVLSDPEVREQVEKVLSSTPSRLKSSTESTYGVRHLIKRTGEYVQFATETMRTITEITEDEAGDLALVSAELAEVLADLRFLASERKTQVTSALDAILRGA